MIGDQDKLNLLITKSAIMQKEINNCQINLREKRLHGHGRMGGMMGMMGRMGGMGGMGSMGGMGRLGGGMGRMGMGF